MYFHEPRGGTVSLDRRERLVKKGEPRKEGDPRDAAGKLDGILDIAERYNAQTGRV